ncbi:4-hydroxy-tetrahydrodipicolinate synthase [Moraxella osloensis]|nr:4-hydroxy-tetrahydrodipicolinate synthase [Moraxella osloensis]MBW4018419.1 4-hydroxy-tetrahydrodipicolinate synthase [Moraxella osloensis]
MTPILDKLQGSMVALITPMHSNGDVDWQSLANLIDWQIEQGTDVLVSVGTTGESATLSMQEHVDVIEFTMKQVGGRIPVIAGTGANNTVEAIDLTQHAKQAGADAVLLVVPYYNKPTQEGLYLHYKAIAEAVDIPQVLYNVPGRTIVDMQQATVERLADIENIIAIKDATGDVARGAKLIEAVKGRMIVLSGDDESALTLMRHGAKGNISVTANVAPKIMSQIFGLALKGEFEQAEALNQKIAHLHQDLFIESSPIPAKYALYKMGHIEQGIRLPLTWLTPEHQQVMDEALAKAGLL